MTDPKHISTLTPKQETLAKARASGKSYEECAQTAGYSSRQAAHRAVVTNDDVSSRVGEHVAEALNTAELSPEWVLKRLMDLANGDKVKDGALVRTLELLGKTDRGGALFSDRVKTETVDPEQSANEAASLIVSYLDEHNVQANKADVLLWVLGHYGLSH